MSRTAVLAALVLSTGCGLLLDPTPSPDASVDAGLDAGVGFDARIDLVDASWDGPEVEPGPFTLVAGLDNRAPGAGPFWSGPMIQGEPTAPLAPTGDVLRVEPGRAIAAGIHERGDIWQGTIVFSVTPEWSIDELVGPRTLVRASGVRLFVDPESQGIGVEHVGGASYLFGSVAAGWDADEPHFVVYRWSRGAPLSNGGPRASLRVDGDLHAAALDLSVLSVTEPGPVVIGADEDGAHAADAIIGGLTVYRRPLRDGDTGVGLDGVDEVAAIIANEGTDPTEVTGSWDVVFAFPGIQQEGPLRVDAGAWSHPLGENLLGDRGLLQGTDGWEVGGSPVTRLPEGARVFSGGLAVVGRMRTGLTLTPGRSYVARAVAHAAEGGGGATLEIQVGATPIAVAGREESTVRDADTLMVTFTAPDEPSVPVSLALVGPGSRPAHFHHVEVLENLVVNPSFEGPYDAPCDGSTAPWGWSCEETQGGGSDATYPHSGQLSYRVQSPSSPEWNALVQELPGLENDRFYACGGWFQYGGGSAVGIHITNGSMFRHDQPAAMPNDEKMRRLTTDGRDAGGWQHLAVVGRRLFSEAGRGLYNAQNDIVRWGAAQFMGGAEFRMDDAYVVALLPAPIDARPADLAASTGPDALRIDGFDRATQTVTGPTPERGWYRFTVRVGRAPQTVVDTCEGTATLIRIGNPAGEGVHLYRRDDDLVLDVQRGGASAQAVAGGARPDADATVEYLIRYGVGYGVELLVDGASVAVAPLDAPFSDALREIAFGGATEPERCDGYVTLPGVVSRDYGP